MYRSSGTFFKIIRGKVLKQDGVSDGPVKELQSEETFHLDLGLVNEGDIVEGIFERVQPNRMYAPVLKGISDVELVIPLEEDEMAKFLKSKLNKVGNVTIRKMMDAYSLEVFSGIKENPQSLVDKGVHAKKVEAIAEQMENLTSFKDLSAYLFPLGVPIAISHRIFNKFGTESLQIVQSEPYSTLKEEEVRFKDADNIAKYKGWAPNNPERLIWSVQRYLVTRNLFFGDVCRKVSDVKKEFNSWLSRMGAYPNIKDNLVTYEECEKAIKLASQRGMIVLQHEENFNDSLVYLPEMAKNENGLVDAVTKLLKDFREPVAHRTEVEKYLQDLEESNEIHLAINQRKSVVVALTNNISIITGGPGTGKSTVVNTIVRAYESISGRDDICLLAPTGKAAKRLGEITKKETMTIHRKLKLGGFGDGEGLEEIEDGLLIVDEFSMVDIELASVLLNNISDRTHVVIVGDVDQLPSVGAGLVLKDMIESKVIQTTVLNEVFRQSKESDIVTKAYELNSGKTGIQFRSNSDMVFVPNNEPLKIKELISRSINKLIDSRGRTIEDICVLSPMKKGALGTIELNEMIQKIANPKTFKKKEIKLDPSNEASPVFREGDRVIHLENDIDKNVMNGEVGIIDRVYWDLEEDEFGQESRVEAMDVLYPDDVLGEKTVKYTRSELKTVELAYALSIHKSQGSEFKVVITPISMSHKNMLYRNLYYTAWTRSKELCINIGQHEALDYCAGNISNMYRFTDLKRKLQHI